MDEGVGSNQCFGCGEANECGLQLHFEQDGDRVVCRTVLDDQFCGYPGVAHGGIVATMLDEAVVHAWRFEDGRMMATGELKVRYRRPVPAGVPIEVIGMRTGGFDRIGRARGEIRMGGKLLAEAEAVLVAIRPEQFEV